MTVVCISWETIHLHGEAWISHHRLRHRLFIQRRGWKLPSHNGLEYDQFDTPAAKYLIWLDPDHQARAVTRLIPTTSSYMLRSLWSDWPDIELPNDPRIWEASRFGCDHSLTPTLRRQATAELICACQEFGVSEDIERYICVMPLRILKRVIAAVGCPVELLSAPRAMDGLRTAVAYVHVSQEILSKVRGLTSTVDQGFAAEKVRPVMFQS